MSRKLVDPELLPILEVFPVFDFSSPESLAALRVGIAQLLGTPPRGDPGIRTEEFHVPGPAGAPEVRVLAYFPRERTGAAPAVLHLHGGGYVMGTPEMQGALSRKLVKTLGCAVFSVDYRLAPETPFPGPVEDAYAALLWLHANAGALGVDRGRIGVKGESAGGGLAAGLTLLARDRGECPLAFQQLIYPMIDDRTCTKADPHPYAGEFVWTPGHNAFGWTALLGRPPGGEDVSPYAAAARANDLQGLPPTFISCGALDLFLEENLDFARRLTRAGVPVELHIYPGVFHGSDLMLDASSGIPKPRVAASALRDSLDSLRRIMHG